MPPVDPIPPTSRGLFARIFRARHPAAGTVPEPNIVPLELEPVPPRTDECPICMEQLADNCIVTKCGHYFHRECLTQVDPGPVG